MVFALVFVAMRAALTGDPVRQHLVSLRPTPAVDVAAPTPTGKAPGAVEGIGERLLDVRLLRPLKNRLARADLPLRPGEALMAGALSDAALTLLLAAFVGPIGLLLGTGITVLGGKVLLDMLGTRRRRRIEAALPDYLQAVANGLRAGHALASALEAGVGTQTGPLEEEVSRTVKEIRLGIPLEEALDDLVRRSDLMEMEMAVTAIIVQRQVGGNLAEVLDRIQATLRERVRIAGEVRALTAQGRLSGLIVGALPLGLGVIMWLLDPAFLTPLATTSFGHILMVAAAILEGLGAYAISRVVRVDF